MKQHSCETPRKKRQGLRYEIHSGSQFKSKSKVSTFTFYSLRDNFYESVYLQNIREKNS